MKDLKAKEKPKLHIVSFSGGKDSTAMLLRMIEEEYPIDVILFCDTGLEFPELHEHIKKVENYIKRKVTTLKSEYDFMYYATEKTRTIINEKTPGLKTGDVVKGYGYPTVKARWCTKHLKIKVMDEFLKDLKKDYDVIRYVGIASDEIHRKRDLNYPLIDWGMTEKDCLDYCYSRGFDWGGLYEIWDRVSCYCCPLQSLGSLRLLRENRPLLYEQIRKMDQTINEKCRSRGFNKRLNFKFDISFTDIERRFEVEDEFIKNGKKLRTKEFFQTLKDRGINY